MSAQHTPGPWYWSDNVPDFPKNHRIIVDADGFTIAEPSLMGEANARLIAAAPDMLGVLQAIAADIENRARLGLDAPAWYTRARAAIAKATGGAA